MFIKRMLAAVLVAVTFINALAKHNPKYKVPGWQKVKSFNLCLNGTFQDPDINIVNASYADTLPVVNCQQTGIQIGDFAITCAGAGPQTCTGHLIVGDHPDDSALFISFISDETDTEFQLNHVAVLATSGHFPKPTRFARDDDGNMIDYDQDGNVATLTVHYKAKDKGPVNIVTPRPNP